MTCNECLAAHLKHHYRTVFSLIFVDFVLFLIQFLRRFPNSETVEGVDARAVRRFKESCRSIGLKYHDYRRHHGMDKSNEKTQQGKQMYGVGLLLHRDATPSHERGYSFDEDVL